MQRFFLLITLFTFINCLKAQHDKTWVMGRKNSMVTFHPNTLITTDTFQNFNFTVSRSLSSICNESGDFMFYTSGSKVMDKYGNVMSNGDNMLDPLLQKDWGNYLPMLQGVISLPKGGNEYYIIYQSQSDSTYPTYQQTDRLYYAVVDMSKNNGLGEVISKRNLIYKGYLSEGRLTACRHANGRDWWIMHPGFNSNQYHLFLATPDSITYSFTQALGLSYVQPDFQGQAVFSPDGSKYVVSTTSSRVNIMNFDRCSGELSDYSYVLLPKKVINNHTLEKGAIGCSFSANNRHLYVNTLQSIYQIDVLDSNRLSHIADWDSSFTWWYYPFDNSYLTPDNKIFISSYGGGSYAFHIIENPDAKADSVIFLHDHFAIPNIVTSSPISNMPHYRLGKLTGSPCDTIVSTDIYSPALQNNNLLKLYPNPATDYIHISLIEYTPQASITISDATGKIIHQQGIYLDSDVNVSQWAKGVYFIRIESKNHRVGVRKFVKQ